MAVDQLTRDAEDMRVLVRNLKEQERRVSPTSHAPVLLMPAQKFMRAILAIENAFAPTMPFIMRADGAAHVPSSPQAWTSCGVGPEHVGW